jgi:DNA-binding NarL/FixJ family response regulator
MIRVYLYPNEEFPESLIARLHSCGDIQFLDEPSSADVLLVYSANYNRMSSTPMTNVFKKLSKPSLVFYEKCDEAFLKDKTTASAIRCDASLEQIFAALHATASGLKVFNGVSGNSVQLPETISLTPRELEILRLIADGEGNKSIAYLLEISEHTVKFHITSIFEKLHVSSRTEAIKAGIQRGMISI